MNKKFNLIFLYLLSCCCSCQTKDKKNIQKPDLDIVTYIKQNVKLIHNNQENKIYFDSTLTLGKLKTKVYIIKSELCNKCGGLLVFENLETSNKALLQINLYADIIASSEQNDTEQGDLSFVDIGRNDDFEGLEFYLNSNNIDSNNIDDDEINLLLTYYFLMKFRVTKNLFSLNIISNLSQLQDLYKKNNLSDSKKKLVESLIQNRRPDLIKKYIYFQNNNFHILLIKKAKSSLGELLTNEYVVYYYII